MSKVQNLIKRAIPVPDNLIASDKFRLTACYAIAYFLMLAIATVVFATYLKTKEFGISAWLHLAGMAVTGSLVYSYKYYINFTVVGLVTMVASNLAVLGIAFSSKAGLFDPILVFLYVSVFICAVASGWRAGLLSGVLAMISILVLGYYNTTQPVIGITGRTDLEEAIFLKVLYSEVALALFTSVISFLIYHLHQLFHRMEETMETVKNAEKSKSQFLANMSHEIRTPLNGVIGMSGLLLKTQLDKTQHQYASIVNDCSKNLITIINDVLDISKLDAGMFTLRPEVFKIRDMLNNVGGLHSANAASKGLALTVNIEDNVPNLLNTDKGRLQQVLNNLISNAIKFTEHGGVALIVRGQPNGHDHFKTEFLVSDSGIGLSPEDCENVFKRFHQVDNSLSRQQDGTGLGLSICHEFVNFLGGELRVKSVEGKGTTFYFKLNLPIVQSEAHPLTKAPQSLPQAIKNPQTNLRATG